MNYRYTAVMATIFNSVQDAILDYAVNKFDYYKFLFHTSFFAFLFQLIYGLSVGLTATYASLPYLFLHAVFILFGYIGFIKSLKYLPLGLVGLLESSSLFITLFIDSFLGYIQITSYFLLMLAILIFSIVLFSSDCLAKEKGCVKNIKARGFFYIAVSIFLYSTAPYLVKMSGNLGANAVTINLVYYIFALPYFAYQYFCYGEKTYPQVRHWWNSFFFLSLVVGVLESAYWILETFSFINDIPTIVVIIDMMRIFLMFILSVMFKMDKFTIRKAIALVLGVFSVVSVYYH